MNARIDLKKWVSSNLGQAMLTLSAATTAAGLEPSLLELVRMRASQLNFCAYCIDMHTKDARAQGETEQRLYALSAWREAPFYSERERAALEWTEAVTLVGERHAPDEIFERVRQHFDESEFVALTFAVAVINTWNRLAVSFRVPVGTYQPNAVAHAAGLESQAALDT